MRRLPIQDALNAKVRDIVGVIETGFFIGMAEMALIAGADGVRRIAR